MLILFSKYDLDRRSKEIVREEIKQRTDEDCIILGPGFNDVKQIFSEKEWAAHRRAWTAQDD